MKKVSLQNKIFICFTNICILIMLTIEFEDFTVLMVKHEYAKKSKACFSKKQNKNRLIENINT